jgi:hypothetical protein
MGKLFNEWRTLRKEKERKEDETDWEALGGGFYRPCKLHKYLGKL